jgi:hypothetical protein
MQSQPRGLRWDHLETALRGKDKVTQVLKALGYDGITHIGGRIMGTHDHRVWIAFDPPQIKGVENRGTFNPMDNRIAYQRLKTRQQVAEENAKYRRLGRLARQLEVAIFGRAGLVDRYARAIALERYAGHWEESKHPRDEGGRFSEAPGGQLGFEFDKPKPQDVPQPEPKEYGEISTRMAIAKADSKSKGDWVKSKQANYRDVMEHNRERIDKVHGAVTNIGARLARLDRKHDRENDKFQKLLDQATALGGLQATKDKNPGLWNAINEQSDKVSPALKDYAKYRQNKNEAAWKAIKSAFKKTAGLETIKKVKVKRSNHLSRLQNIDRVEAFLSGMISDVYKERTAAVRVQEIPPGQKQRAHFAGHQHGRSEPGIYLGTFSGDETIAHEFGHNLEQGVILHQAAIGFLHSRIGEEPAKPLGGGYDPWEVGRDDEFSKAFGESARYVGKHYDTEDTEIVSMGLQKLYEDPVGFAEADPEYFKFMIAVLDGSFQRSF